MHIVFSAGYRKLIGPTGTSVRASRWWKVILMVFVALAASALIAEAQFAFEYKLEERGQVSAAVYNDEGRMVRELLRGQEQGKGRHAISWDGLDRSGKPVPPGSYEWRVLRKPKFRAEYITSLGINPDSKPYDTWVGSHGGAASVAVDSSGMYTAAELTETAPVLLKQSLDGKRRLWTRSRGDVTHGRFQGGTAMASDGQGTLYMLQQNGRLQPIDAKTGGLQVDKYNRQGKWDPLPEAVKEKIDTRKEVRFRYSSGLHKVAGADVAAHGDTLVIAFRDQNTVRWLDTQDGSITHRVQVPQPFGVAVGPDEQVYVISQKRVLAVHPENGIQRVVIKEDLVAPRRLTFDPGNSHLLIADHGESQQVKRFSPGGELIAEYGREGGRRDGPYEPEDFLGVNDIAADGNGGFLVAEPSSGARRVAHFDEDGTLIKEWFGGQPYYAWGEPDPRNPSKVWFNPGEWLALAELDYETGRWELLETYHIDSMADGLIQSMPGHRGRWRVLYHGGQCYLVSEADGHVLAYGDGTLRAVSVTGRLHNYDRPVELAGRGEDARTFRWLDRNGDGEPQSEEFTFSKSGTCVGNGWVASDFAYVVADDQERNGRKVLTISEFRPRWTEHGPAYPIGEEQAPRRVGTTPVIGGTGSRGRGTYRSKSGSYYAHFNDGHERHGTSWPTYWGGRSRFVKWDSEGTERWRVGRHAVHGGLGDHPHTTPNGYMHVPAEVIGETDRTVVMADRVENIAMNWTRDGLYAGDFFDARVDDGLPDRVYHWWRTPAGEEAIVTSDNAQGGRVVQLDDGTVLWLVQGRNSVPIYRIHGWDGWERQNGTVTIDSPVDRASGHGKGLTATYHIGAELTGGPEVTRVDTQVWHGVPRGTEGNQTVVDGWKFGPAYDWSHGVNPLKVKSGFAVRWRGQIEAPLSEDYTFSVYKRGGARLWLDGQQRIFAWNEMKNRWETGPIELKAAERYSVQLDYFTTRKQPACSLNWESFSLDRERIPQKYLYPDRRKEIVHRPDVRPSGQWIDARSFDEQSGDIAADNVRSSVRGIRDKGLSAPDAYLRYDRVDLGDSSSELAVRVRGRPAGSDADFKVTLAFRVGGSKGRKIAAVHLGYEQKETYTVPVEGASGVRDLFIVNESPDRWHFVYLEGFRFE